MDWRVTPRRRVPPAGIIASMDGSLLPNLKVDRSVLTVSDLNDENGEKAYWLARTPQERINQIEILRRINYGDAATARLQRVLEVVERSES